MLRREVYLLCTGDEPPESASFRGQRLSDAIAQTVRTRIISIDTGVMLIAVCDIRVTTVHDVLYELWKHQLVAQESTTLILCLLKKG